MPSHPPDLGAAAQPAHEAASARWCHLTGTITSVENAGGPLVTVVVKCADRVRFVPVDGADWAARVRERGPTHVIGAAVTIVGSGAAASLAFEAAAP